MARPPELYWISPGGRHRHLPAATQRGGLDLLCDWARHRDYVLFEWDRAVCSHYARRHPTLNRPGGCAGQRGLADKPVLRPPLTTPLPRRKAALAPVAASARHGALR